MITMSEDKSLQGQYETYMKQIGELSSEMQELGIQYIKPWFCDIKFKVYPDGTAEIPVRRSFPWVGRRSTKKVGLESLGELLYHLTRYSGEGYKQKYEGDERRWWILSRGSNPYSEIPKDLSSINKADIIGLIKHLNTKMGEREHSRKHLEGLEILDFEHSL